MDIQKCEPVPDYPVTSGAPVEVLLVVKLIKELLQKGRELQGIHGRLSKLCLTATMPNISARDETLSVSG